jgi:hypothetical protein
MTDRLAGKTIRWTFSDGPMKNKTFEHLFDEKGSVKFRSVGDDGSETFTEVKKYEVAAVKVGGVCGIIPWSFGLHPDGCSRLRNR